MEAYKMLRLMVKDQTSKNLFEKFQHVENVVVSRVIHEHIVNTILATSVMGFVCL